LGEALLRVSHPLPLAAVSRRSTALVTTRRQNRASLGFADCHRALRGCGRPGRFAPCFLRHRVGQSPQQLPSQEAPELTAEPWGSVDVVATHLLALPRTLSTAGLSRRASRPTTLAASGSSRCRRSTSGYATEEAAPATIAAEPTSVTDGHGSHDDWLGAAILTPPNRCALRGAGSRQEAE